MPFTSFSNSLSCLDEVESRSAVEIGCISAENRNRNKKLPEGLNGVSVDLVEPEGCSNDVVMFAWNEDGVCGESKEIISIDGIISVFQNPVTAESSFQTFA